jgi:transposase InsO family protein
MSELFSRQYNWKMMRRQVDQYLWNSAECPGSRTSRHARVRVLHAHRVLTKPCEDISMAVVTGLPEWEWIDPVWIVPDTLAHMRHCVPCRTTVAAWGLVELLLKEVVRLHGLQRTKESDRRPQFAAFFWKWLCEQLGIDRQLSTACHPKTDGQTERIHGGMEQYLRLFTSHQQDDWVK